MTDQQQAQTTTEPQAGSAPEPQAASAQSQSQQSNFSVPEAYKGKGWVEKIKSTDDMWKQIDNLQSLIGRRPAGIPQDGAPKEEWDKFYAAIGRPESPDKYEMKDIEGLPEGFDSAPFKAKAAKIAHDIGLSPKQAEKLWQAYLTEEMGASKEQMSKHAETQKALDAEFDAITKEHFGDGVDAANKRAQETINRLVPEKLRGAYAEIADKPKALAALMALTEGMHKEIEAIRKEYGAEGKLVSGGQTSSQNIEDVRKELASLRTSTEAKDFLHPKNKETIKKINDLAGIVAAHYRKS